MKFHIDKRAILGFLTALLILLWLGYYSYKNNQNFIETRGLVLHTTQVLNHIEQTHTNAVRVEEILAKYIITEDSSFLVHYNQEIRKAAAHYKDLIELTKDNPEQLALIDTFRIYGKEKLIVHQKIIDAMRHSKEQAEGMIDSRENMAATTRVNEIISKIRNRETNLLEARIEQSRMNMKNFQKTFFALMIANLVILVAVFLIINKSFGARIFAERKAMVVNKELEAFTYSVSHDLRAPLRSIRGFADVLKEEYGSRLDDEGNRLLDIVMRNASRMGQLIDDLLDFSRMGRKDLAHTNINMSQLVDEVISELTAGEKRKIEWDIGPLKHVWGDINMMKQVWINLISNALKYTRKTEKPCIEIGCSPKSGLDIFYIRDNGVGFDMQYSNKLFNVFQRLHNVKDFEGTGVGLALCHRIVSRHNGDIWAEAKVNQGATFFFYIPN